MQSEAEAQLDATLNALNQVQPPARLEQRIHARLAQQAGSPQRLFLGERLASAWSWPRAAFAAATFSAGAVTAALVLPMLHAPVPHPASAGTTWTGAATAGSAAPVSHAPLVNAENAHPAMIVKTPDGRAAAMNPMGTVATFRSRKEHTDMQLAANKQQRKGAEAKVEAKLAKPASPKQAQAGPPDAAPAPDSATQPNP
jgi:hypothetical protein